MIIKADIEEAVKKLQKLGQQLGDEKAADKAIKKALERVTLTAQNKLRNRSGNLSESIGVYKDNKAIARKDKRFGLFTGPRIFGSYKGYHGHLVEFGTKERTRKSNDLLVIRLGGKIIFSRSKKLGKVEPQKYMYKSWSEQKTAALNTLEQEIVRLTKKALR